MRYRFVNRAGWEKWIDITGTPPDSWAIIESEPLRDVFDPNAQVRQSYATRRIFHHQDWRHGPDDGTEIVFSEDMAPVDESRFGLTYPSLWREQKLATAMRMVASLSLGLDSPNPLGEMLLARARIEEIGDVVGGLTPQLLGLDPMRCIRHRDCRADAEMGWACRRASLKESDGR